MGTLYKSCRDAIANALALIRLANNVKTPADCAEWLESTGPVAEQLVDTLRSIDDREDKQAENN